MAELKDIKAMRSGDTIVLHYKGETLNIQKASRSADFKRVEKLIEAGDVDGIITAFCDIKKMIETYTKDKLTVTDGVLVDRDGISIPPPIAKKLMQLKNANEDFLPLWRFWTKLKKNPSKNSVEQLYSFLEANHIPITNLGDFVVEKGVRQQSDGTLVDAHTGKFDNSIGMIVEMNRKDVVDDKNQTCSAGLHVAAPAYVKECYGSSVIVECIVNPADVVSVPVDYKSQKMRVCRYQVVALAKKNSITTHVVKMEDLVALPKMEERRENQSDSNGTQTNTLMDLMKLTAKGIISHVRKLTGKRITLDPKNKAAIAKKAEQILHAAGKAELPMSAEGKKSEKKEAKEERSIEIVLTGMKCSDVIAEVAKIIGKDEAEKLAGSDPRRGRFIAKVTPILLEKKYVVID